ncbi:HAMP domain-containing protein, partial [Tistlia consotensis]
MKFVTNAPILVKSLIAPLLAVVMIVVIGVVFLSTYLDLQQQRQSQMRISSLRSDLQGALLELSSAHLETLKATNWKQSQVDEKLIDKAIAAARASIDKVQSTLERLGAGTGQGEDEQIATFAKQFAAYRQSADQTLTNVPVDAFLALMYLNDTQAKETAAIQTGRKILADIAAADGAIAGEVDSSLRNTLIAVLATAGLAILLSLGAAVLLGRAISRPTTRLTAAMTRLTEGDTSVAIEGTERRDELGRMASAVQVFKENMIRNVELSRQTA